MPCVTCKFSEAPRDNQGHIVLNADVVLCKFQPHVIVVPARNGMMLNTVWAQLPKMEECGQYQPKRATASTILSAASSPTGKPS